MFGGGRVVGANTEGVGVKVKSKDGRGPPWWLWAWLWLMWLLRRRYAVRLNVTVKRVPKPITSNNKKER